MTPRLTSFKLEDFAYAGVIALTAVVRLKLFRKSVSVEVDKRIQIRAPEVPELMRLKRGERRRTLVQLALHYRGDLLHGFGYPDVLTREKKRHRSVIVTHGLTRYRQRRDLEVDDDGALAGTGSALPR